MGTQTKAQLETRILELEKQISTVEAASFPINLWINVSEKTGKRWTNATIRDDARKSLSRRFTETGFLSFHVHMNEKKRPNSNDPDARGRLRTPRRGGQDDRTTQEIESGSAPF